MERQTTSIKVDPKIWQEAKIYAIRKGINISDLIEDLLKKKIKEG